MLLLILTSNAASLQNSENYASLDIHHRILSTNETSRYFASNHPGKKMLFDASYQAYQLTITNPTPHAHLIQSNKTIPTPLQPDQVTYQLKQSTAALPWLMGIGWATLLTKVIGLALIPCIVLGATVIIAGSIGIQQRNLPATTDHAIKHLLLDNEHNYLIPPFDHASLIVILPHHTEQLSLCFKEQDSNNDHHVAIHLKNPIFPHSIA